MTEGRLSPDYATTRTQRVDDRRRIVMWLQRCGFLQFLSACCLMSSAFCYAAQANQQEELRTLRGRIAAMQHDLEKTSETKSEAADLLRESELAISDTNRKLAELAEKLRDVNQKLTQLKTQQQTLSGAMTKQHALLGNLLHQQYLGGKQEYLKLLLNNHDPNQVARELHYYQYIARSRADWLAKLRTELAMLNTISAAALEQQLLLTELRTEQAAQKNALAKQQRSRQKMLLSVSKQLSQQRHEISRLQRNEAKLAQLVAKITAMLARPEANSIFRSEKLPDNRFDGSAFDQLKGKLALPVKGEVTNRFGTPRPDSTILWKGLFVRTSRGQPVKAVAAGQVVFSDWLRGFGNLLIVDHGKGYMSLYGNNESLYKQVGDLLRGGDTIGLVGNSGGNEVSGLYFELRHKSEPLDPIKWLATK